MPGAHRVMEIRGGGVYETTCHGSVTKWAPACSDGDGRVSAWRILVWLNGRFSGCGAVEEVTDEEEAEVGEGNVNLWLGLVRTRICEFQGVSRMACRYVCVAYWHTKIMFCVFARNGVQ